MKTIPKNRSQAVQDAIKGSQEILKLANINLFDDADKFAEFVKNNKGAKAGAENFAWALSREGYGLHSDAYALKVYELLKKAESGGKQAIEDALAEMRRVLQRGDKFW